MPAVVNTERCFTKLADPRSPRIVGEQNGRPVEVVRLEGDQCPRHTHDQKVDEEETRCSSW